MRSLLAQQHLDQCTSCFRYGAKPKFAVLALTQPQGIGDKLRIVALHHSRQQQQRSASYHSGEGAHVAAPPQSMSWSASSMGGGAIHEC
jgi:hypothetical protein